MKIYIGCKIIKAERMDLDTFNEAFRKILPEPQLTSKEGYHVLYPDGYHSWSPKAIFEKAYRAITGAEAEFYCELSEYETSK